MKARHSAEQIVAKLRQADVALGNRAVATEALVRPGDMVAVVDELPQQTLQVALAQDDHMIQKLSA